VSRDRFGAIVFTDIVDSTQEAARFGDERWAELLMRHDAAVRDAIDRRHGDCLKFTGDGYLVTFSLCEDGLRCAAALQGIAAEYGLTIRCGMHAGDYSAAGEDAVGLAVIIASRLMSAAGAGRILVSNAVVTAVAGANFEFGPDKELTLKGVPGTTVAAELLTDCDVQNTASRWRPDPAIHGPSPTWLDRLVLRGARRFPSAAHVLAKSKHGGDGAAPVSAARRRGLAGPALRRS
jgi:class 3 adenylate cyclase